jgi:hypothetical protein
MLVRNKHLDFSAPRAISVFIVGRLGCFDQFWLFVGLLLPSLARLCLVAPNLSFNSILSLLLIHKRRDHLVHHDDDDDKTAGAYPLHSFER